MPTRKNVLIENGVLKSYMVDKLHARMLGCEPTGSSRRQSFRFEPTSRMTNTYIAPGTDSPEQMIASTERGIFVKAINAGSVNPATGEFNFNTGETFLIENGKITTRLEARPSSVPVGIFCRRSTWSATTTRWARASALQPAARSISGRASRQ